jgi:hypothetical protein
MLMFTTGSSRKEKNYVFIHVKNLLYAWNRYGDEDYIWETLLKCFAVMYMYSRTHIMQPTDHMRKYVPYMACDINHTLLLPFSHHSPTVSLMQHMLCRTRCRGSVVSAATRWRAWRTGIRNHQVGGEFLISKHEQTGSGAYPSYTSMNTGVPSPG